MNVAAFASNTSFADFSKIKAITNKVSQTKYHKQITSNHRGSIPLAYCNGRYSGFIRIAHQRAISFASFASFASLVHLRIRSKEHASESYDANISNLGENYKTMCGAIWAGWFLLFLSVYQQDQILQ